MVGVALLRQEDLGALDGDVAAGLADRELLADVHERGWIDEAGFHENADELEVLTLSASFAAHRS